MARPLRFRFAPGTWSLDRIRSEVYSPLDDNLGATMGPTWFRPPAGYESRRFDVDNGDTALFCWTTETGNTHDGRPGAYWLGNTETPSSLWRTDKFGFAEVPAAVAEWAERELLAQLHDESPWLEPYPHISWFFLPVFLSKDGRESTRRFFAEHAAGFPDAGRDEALGFYEAFLSGGTLDEERELMAGKLGTSKQLDLVRMSASMGEFNAAWILSRSGYDVHPEAEVTTGHSLDFRVEGGDHPTLVEVTRPLPPNDRAAGSPVVAVRETAQTKTSGQLAEHGGGATLFVDCSSFPDDDWAAVKGERPDVRHRPAVVFRVRPDGTVEAYRKGSVPLSLDVEWV